MTEGNKNHTETEIMLGALDQVIREEMKKRPSKRDNKLIDECIVEMAKLKNVRTGYTEEEIDAIVKQIEAKAAKKTERVPVRRKSVRRMAAVVCAACLIMAGSVAAVAWNPFHIMCDWIDEITNTISGTDIQIENITYSNHGKQEKYNDIYELVKNENLRIYYPVVLPENVCITRVELLEIDNKECINFCFNDPDFLITIQLNTSLYLNTPEYETIKINDITFYLAYQNDKYVVQSNIGADLYIIEGSDYEDILLIINNLTKGN